MKEKTIYRCDRCGKEFQVLPYKIPTHLTLEYYNPYESISGYVKKEYDLCVDCYKKIYDILMEFKKQ